MKALICVIYDGIHNSVFESQVLEPLKKRHLENPNLPIIIVSFERSIPTQEELADKIPEGFYCTIFKKRPFLGKWSLWPAIVNLNKLLGSIPSYQIIARGPFAGYIAKKAMNKSNQCIIQARGLAAQEYAYTTAHDHKSYSLITAYRYKQLEALEYAVYNTLPSNCTIEAVSTALADYLRTTFATPKHALTIASNDIPRTIDPETLKSWRAAQRTALNIDQQALVYCYAGSLKPWQCPGETIFFFKKEWELNTNSFLLILSQDKKEFLELAQKHALDPRSYAIVHANSNTMYQYLAAADYGIIFREKHVMNWVSRPTKILEYQAAGLSIIHNNTIELLCSK